MKRLLPILALCALAACSRQPSVEGAWKNAMGNLITFQEGGAARLGQEGYPDTQKAHWEFHGDTLVVTTEQQPGSSDAVNVFRLRPGTDTLHFEAIELHRPGMVQRLPGAEFARRLGREPWAVAFTRVKEKK